MCIRDRAKGVKRIGPFAVPKAMSSGPSAVLSTWFKIRGINYSITSACATSALTRPPWYTGTLMAPVTV